MPGDHKVGRGRPPKHTRFKAGQSGNPKGRPRGSRNIATIIEHVMAQKITVIENGRKKTMSAREAILRALLNDALRGNDKSRAMLINLDLQKQAQGAEAEVSDVKSRAAQSDKEIMARFVGRMAKKIEGERQGAKLKLIPRAIRKLPHRLNS